jgi:hypothetical protein
MTHRENGSAGRVFRLVRDADRTGVSGTGHVASGVVWPDGSVTLKWHTVAANAANVSHYANTSTMLDIHGHKSKTYPCNYTTKIVYVDGGANSGRDVAWELSEFAYQLGALLEYVGKGIPADSMVENLRKSYGRILDIAQAAS